MIFYVVGNNENGKLVCNIRSVFPTVPKIIASLMRRVALHKTTKIFIKKFNGILLNKYVDYLLYINVSISFLLKNKVDYLIFSNSSFKTACLIFYIFLFHNF